MSGDGKACARGQFDSSRFVFFGKVVDRDIKTERNQASPADTQPRPPDEPVRVVGGQEWQPGYTYIATIEVITGWKGFRSERVFVIAEMADGVNCGVDLKIGTSYLFFTYPRGNAYGASGCNVAGEDTAKLLPKGRSIKRKTK